MGIAFRVFRCYLSGFDFAWRCILVGKSLPAGGFYYFPAGCLLRWSVVIFSCSGLVSYPSFPILSCLASM
ncbi:unnamed protein product [Amoebophrya sp. A120]|nr:unnamed protein product [Amoebophrya sp. A120]|eukprot:GSA120T00022858001.1